MSENRGNSPAQSTSKGINNEENAPITSRQISNFIEFQGPSTSNNNYSFKTQIRINIREPRISQRSMDSDDSSFTLSLFEDKISKDPMEAEESFVTLDTCIKEKTTSTIVEPVVLFSRNERTQRTILSQSEAPPPYESHPPPAYHHRQEQEAASTDYHSVESLDIPFSPFAEMKIRHAFVQKVFSIIFGQLSITTAMILLVIYHNPSKQFVLHQKSLMWVMLGLFVNIFLSLLCIQALRRTFPVNFVFFLLFAVSLSYLCATATAIYDTKIFLGCAAGTGIVCLVVILLAFQTRFDVTDWSFILFIITLLVFLCGIVTMSIHMLLNWNTFWMTYSGLAVIVFTLFLLYDMQCILDGKRVPLSPKEYIYGALNLYTDTFKIFSYLFHCSRSVNR